jgi:hypothetical protein
LLAGEIDGLLAGEADGLLAARSADGLLVVAVPKEMILR